MLGPYSEALGTISNSYDRYKIIKKIYFQDLKRQSLDSVENYKQQLIEKESLLKLETQGIGVLIHERYQRAGFANEALALLISYCFKTLHLHQLFANITPDNPHSIALFMGHGFKKNGEKKDWLYVNGAFKNQLILQLINE